MIQNPDTHQPTIESRVQELAKYMLLLRKVQDQSAADLLSSLSGLSMQEVNVINIIGDNQPCIMSEIAKQASLSLSSVTGIVDKLVKAKLVKRVRSEEDRRIVRGSLTSEGEQIYQLQIKHMHGVLQKILSMLSDEEQETFVNIFKKITRSFVRT